MTRVAAPVQWEAHAWHERSLRPHQQLRAWTDELVARAEPLGFTAPGRSQPAGHMVGLSSERALRPGLGRAFAERGVYVGIRGSCIRVAPHLHATLDALDRFIEALQAIPA